MHAPRLLLVTGKGGVGKTTVTAALGVYLSERRRHVLIAELAADRGLAQLFGRERLEPRPGPLAPRLDGVRIERRELVEGYFRRILRVRFLSERLLSSITFNAITTAAPGVTEFLVLERLLGWFETGKRGRPPYDVVLVDAPATGHALRLLRTPGQLAGMVPAGPIASTAQRILALLGDRERTQVVLVSNADEMAVSETLEARETLTATLGLELARPVLNRVFPMRFTAADADAVARMSEGRPRDPLLAAARLQISARRESERQRTRLRRAFGLPPITLSEVCAHSLERADLERMGRTLGNALFRS